MCSHDFVLFHSEFPCLWVSKRLSGIYLPPKRKHIKIDPPIGCLDLNTAPFDVLQGELFTKQSQEGQEGGRASTSTLMSWVTFAPQAHINTWLTGADKMEAMDKLGQSGLSEGVWGRPASATDHSVSSITQRLTAPWMVSATTKHRNKQHSRQK